MKHILIYKMDKYISASNWKKVAKYVSAIATMERNEGQFLTKEARSCISHLLAEHGWVIRKSKTNGHIWVSFEEDGKGYDGHEMLEACHTAFDDYPMNLPAMVKFRIAAEKWGIESEELGD